MSAVIERPQQTLIAKIASRYEVNPEKMLVTLKATAFKQRADKDGSVRDISNEEMMSLLVIADQYHLNPFTKELYAFLDRKSGGIVPVVSVDGWARIINEHPQLDGIAFSYPENAEAKHKGKSAFEWVECSIYRKDRARPTVIREYFDEVCRNENFSTPWDTHPKRMHRHKALIQCARVAFGFAGIYDPDEAERILERQVDGERIDEPPKTRTEALKDKLRASLLVPEQPASQATDLLPVGRAVSGPYEGPTLDEVRSLIAKGDMDAAADLANALPDEHKSMALKLLMDAHAKAEV